jgi:hypothetical protein
MAGKNLVVGRHRSCYFICMALVIVLWVGLSVIGCLALLRSASRRMGSAVEPSSSGTRVYTVNSQPAQEPAIIRPAREPALSSNAL